MSQYLYQFCSKCGHRFINPSEDDYADLCPSCRETESSLTTTIQDRFTEDELRRIAAGPNSELNEESIDINDLDNDDDDFEEDADFYEHDEFEDRDWDEAVDDE